MADIPTQDSGSNSSPRAENDKYMPADGPTQHQTNNTFIDATSGDVKMIAELNKHTTEPSSSVTGVAEIDDVIAANHNNHADPNGASEAAASVKNDAESPVSTGDYRVMIEQEMGEDGEEFREIEEHGEYDGDDGELLYGIPSSDNVEKVEYYRLNGFHTVKLGDELNQYKIVHKLGYGGFATVWLARDLKEERYVALKIILAQASQNVEDIDIKTLSHIKECVSKGMFAAYIDIPLDHFWFEGPNGRHMCVVSRFHGPSIASLIGPSKEFRLGLDDSRRMALQLTQSMMILHSDEVGIAHGDFTTSNILLELENMDSWSIEELYEKLGEPSKEPIVDFGESFFLNDAPEGLGTPARFCSPELMLERKCSKASDVWALACTIFEMRSGFTLFQSFMGSDGEALGAILTRLGPAPNHLEALSCLKENEESRSGSKLRDYVESIVTPENSLDAGKDKNTSPISITEAELLIDLLTCALKYDVEERSSAAKMLGHAWLSIACPK